MSNLIDDIKGYIVTAREQMDEFSLLVRTSDKNAVEDLGFIWSGSMGEKGYEFGYRGTVDGVTIHGVYKAETEPRVLVLAIPINPRTVDIGFEPAEKDSVYLDFAPHFIKIVGARMESAEEKNYKNSRFHIKAPYDLACRLNPGGFNFTMGEDITTIQILDQTFHLILDNTEKTVSIIHHYEYDGEGIDNAIDYEEYLMRTGNHPDLTRLICLIRAKVSDNDKYHDKYYLELNVSKDYEPLINRLSMDSAAGRFIYDQGIKTLIKVNICVDLENEINLAFTPKEKRQHATV